MASTTERPGSPACQPTRRAALRLVATAAAAAPVLALPAVALAADRTRPDAALLRLGEELEASGAREPQVLAAYADAPAKEREAAYGAAMDASSAIVGRIERVPARTLDGLLVKALAIAWCLDGEPFDPVGQDTTDVRLALSIVADLRAMGRA